MTPDMKEKMERRRKAVYNAVRAANPDLYCRAVEVAHMATVEFGGKDETRRAAIVEACIMELLIDAAGIEVEHQP